MAIIAEAPTEFVALQGAALKSPADDIAVFAGLKPMAEANGCAVGQVATNGRRSSTSYTCSGLAQDSDAGMQGLMFKLRDCLGITIWNEQTDAQAGNRFAQYGLLRVTVSRNGSLGLALGVEAFRDAQGEVMGSPMRGNRVQQDGSQRCIARKPEEITAMIERYGALPGAKRFENRQFIGYTNDISAPMVSFITKPNHPAHPAIIVRNVYEEDGSPSISAAGDFAGDCQAFHDLIKDVVAMNTKVATRPQ
ncbi:MAG: hypothetical protein ABMA14_12580 [Hyphomonadaceae bacterium]